jgi:hypothetical protein
MLMNNNGNKVENKVDSMEASRKLMEELMGRKIVVKPTLPVGHYTGVFGGMQFVETRYKSTKCMGVQIKYTVANVEYEEIQPLNGAGTVEAQQAALGQVQRYMEQLAAQFDLVGIDVDMELLNQHIGKPIDIKVYEKEFETKTNKTAKARKIGFWRKPVDEAQAEAAITKF